MKLLTFVLKTCASIFLFLIIIGIGNLSANEFQLTEITFKGWILTSRAMTSQATNLILMPIICI